MFKSHDRKKRTKHESSKHRDSKNKRLKSEQAHAISQSHKRKKPDSSEPSAKEQRKRNPKRHHVERKLTYSDKKQIDMAIKCCTSYEEFFALSKQYTNEILPDMHTQLAIATCISNIKNSNEILQILHYISGTTYPFHQFNLGLSPFNHAIKYADFESLQEMLELLQLTSALPDRFTKMSISQCIKNLADGKKALQILKFLNEFNHPYTDLRPDTGSFANAIKCADVDTFKKIIKLLKQSLGKIDKFIIMAVSDCISYQANGKKAYVILEWLNSKSNPLEALKPDTVAYTNALKKADPKVFRDTVYLMHKSGISPDDITLKAIGECMEFQSSADDCLDILDWLETSANPFPNFKGSIMAYTSALKRADFKTMKRILNHMESNKIDVDSIVRNAIGDCLKNQKDINESLAILEYLRKRYRKDHILYPNIVAYNTALVHADSNGVKLILQMIYHDKLDINIETEKAILQSLRQQSMPYEGLNIIAFLKSKDFFFDLRYRDYDYYRSALPSANFDTFKVIMNKLLNIGFTGEEASERHEISQCLANQTDFDEALKILNWLLQKGFGNELVNMNILLKKANFEELKYLIKQMRKYNIYPDRYTSASISISISHLHDPYESLAILTWLESTHNPFENLNPDIIDYTCLIKKANAEVFITAMELLIESQLPLDRAFNAAISHCLEHQQNSNDILKILEWINQNKSRLLGLKIYDNCYTTLIKKATIDNVIYYLDYINSNANINQRHLNKAITQCVHAQKDATQAINIINAINSELNPFEDLQPKYSAYNCALHYANPDEFISLIKIMNQQHITPNSNTLLATYTCMKNQTNAKDIMKIILWLNSDENPIKTLRADISHYNFAIKFAEADDMLKIFALLRENKIMPNSMTMNCININLKQTKNKDKTNALLTLFCNKELNPFDQLKPDENLMASAIEGCPKLSNLKNVLSWMQRMNISFTDKICKNIFQLIPNCLHVNEVLKIYNYMKNFEMNENYRFSFINTVIEKLCELDKKHQAIELFKSNSQWIETCSLLNIKESQATNSTIYSVDLHGFSHQFSKIYVEHLIAKIKDPSFQSRSGEHSRNIKLNVITGIGKHSLFKHGIFYKKNLIKSIESSDCDIQDCKKNPGQVHVRINRHL